MQSITLWVHLILAIFWIGSIFVTRLVLVRVGADEVGLRERIRWLQMVEKRLARPTMLSLLLLVLTGMMNLGVYAHAAGGHISSAFWMVLGVKMVFFIVLVGLSGVRSHRLGSKLTELSSSNEPDDEVLEGLWKKSCNLLNAQCVLAALLVLFALLLRRV